MSSSPLLSLPFLSAGQAQKHVTHNDALSLLDGLVHLAVIARGALTPPATPNDGDRYLLGESPTGDWSGHGGAVALRVAGAWRFFTPNQGWRCWVDAESLLLVYDGTNWTLPVAAAPTSLQNLSLLGVAATADATNRLSVNAPAVLLNNAGNGIQLKLNKNAVTDTASLLYQTGWSGRAEIGTTGNDSFHFKVSADGASWKDALVINGGSGLATAYGDPTAALGLATKQYVDSVAASGAGGGTPGGTTGQVQFKNGASFGGFTVSGDATLNTSTGALTLANNAVSNAKLATMAAGTLKGNNTGSSGAPVDLTVAQAKSLLSITASDVSGLGSLATQSGTFSGTHSGNSSGTNTGDQTITLTGDVTGSGTGSFVATIANRGAANGLATLDATGKLTSSQIPAALVGAVVYQGTWNANTNSPALASGTGTKGWYYKVAVAGATAIDGLSQWNVGDTIIFDGTTWDKIDGIANEVVSVFGRNGSVTAQSGDYAFSQISGSLSATQMPALSGDVTAAAGSTSTTIAAGAVSLGKMANLAANSLIGNNTGSPTAPAALTAAQVKSLLAISASDVSGLGSLASLSSVNLSTLATGTLQAAQAPALTGDVTTSAGSLATTIAAGAVSNAKQANMAALTFKANGTASPAAPQDLTTDQTLVALNFHAQIQARSLIMN